MRMLLLLNTQAKIHINQLRNKLATRFRKRHLPYVLQRNYLVMLAEPARSADCRLVPQNMCECAKIDKIKRNRVATIMKDVFYNDRQKYSAQGGRRRAPSAAGPNQNQSLASHEVPNMWPLTGSQNSSKLVKIGLKLV